MYVLAEEICALDRTEIELDTSMKKKYIVYPGYVNSRIDGQRHFIDAGKLMSLYKVNPKECIVVEYKRKLEGYREEDFISLYPRYSGNYTILDTEGESVNE